MDYHFVRQTMLHRHDDFPSKNPTLAIRLGPMGESRLYKTAHLITGTQHALIR